MSIKSLTDSIVRLTGDVWGDSVSYTPNGETTISIQGIFNNSWVDIEGVVSLKPTLRINLSDLSAGPAKGDLVTVRDLNYRVTESRPDDYGGATLILQKV